MKVENLHQYGQESFGFEAENPRELTWFKRTVTFPEGKNIPIEQTFTWEDVNKISFLK